MEHLRQQCGPHVTAVAKDSVEGICSKIYQLSAEYSRRLRQTHLSLLQDPPTGTYTHTQACCKTPTLPPQVFSCPMCFVLSSSSHHVFCVCSEACASPQQSRLVYCYPVRLALPSPPLPRVELHFENDVACLRFRGEMVKVNRGHFSKLVSTNDHTLVLRHTVTTVITTT